MFREDKIYLGKLDGAAVANVNEPSPGDLERVLNENAKLLEKLKLAVEALSFYANEINYYQAWQQKSKNSLVVQDVDADNFGGKLARETLAKIKAGK